MEMEQPCETVIRGGRKPFAENILENILENVLENESCGNVKNLLCSFQEQERG